MRATVPLWRWVIGFRKRCRDRFPVPGWGTVIGPPALGPPFPECWQEHPELVLLLEYIKMREDQLADGVAEDGYWPHHWFEEVVKCLFPLLRRIGCECRNGHVDPSARAAARKVVISRPILPGTHRRCVRRQAQR